jgi:hypothetical protein
MPPKRRGGKKKGRKKEEATRDAKGEGGDQGGEGGGGGVDPKALLKLCGREGSGDVDEARDLIARGINIDEQNEYANTTLMQATANNRIEIVKELVRVGAALDLQNKYATSWR